MQPGFRLTEEKRAEAEEILDRLDSLLEPYFDYEDIGRLRETVIDAEEFIREMLINEEQA